MVRTGKLEGFSKYDIYEDGRVYSHYRGRFLKPAINGRYQGYAKVTLMGDDPTVAKIFGVHQLVLRVFVGDAPPGMETHHKDHNKLNNHLDNLEWITHSENIQRSFTDNGREGYWKGKERQKFSYETIKKMSMAKEKTVLACRGDEKLEFDSVERFLDHFGTYRRRFNRCLNEGKLLDGWQISLK